MKQVGFYHSAFADNYEKQANEQGYTLGNKAETFDRIGKAFHMLRIHGYLTDSQADSVCKKIQKNLVKSLQPLEPCECAGGWSR